MPTAQAIPDAEASARLDELLTRGDEQRLREFKYRFGQSAVFGIPVVALQLWGAKLGPADSERWVSLLQAILCGWVVYVNLGMLVEGLLHQSTDSSPHESCESDATFHPEVLRGISETSCVRDPSEHLGMIRHHTRQTHRRLALRRGDSFVALLAVLLYLYSLVSALHGIVAARLWYRPLLFHVCVIVLATWSAIRWGSLARRSRRSASSPAA